ncbi:MAG TPA: hypothetical protein VJQ53_03815 [Candidatus Eisenbacteria bacterium]|nr:hypothetical protein [Candidatus Eisenbacteria bacterium]
MPTDTVLVNRAPVMTLWAAVVAERLGYDRDAALTLGKAVAGLNAQSKGRRLGIYGPPERGAGHKKRPSAPTPDHVPLLGREVPVVETADGLRAVVHERAENPDSVRRYLNEKFGDSLPQVVAAMRALAKAYPLDRLAEIAPSLYEEFRPAIPAGKKGWGAKGNLDLNKVRALARSEG